MMPSLGLSGSEPAIIFSFRYVGSDVTFRLLRARHERPRRRAAEQRDELAPFDHSIILESAARCFPLGIRVGLDLVSLPIARTKNRAPPL